MNTFDINECQETEVVVTEIEDDVSEVGEVGGRTDGKRAESIIFNITERNEESEITGNESSYSQSLLSNMLKTENDD